MKAYSEATLAAIADGSVLTAAALAIYCDPPSFLWTGLGTATIDGDVYVGVNDRAVGSVTGGAIGGSEQSIELQLSGVDPDAAALLNAAELKRSPIKLYKMLFDGSGTICLDCRIFKRGRVDRVQVLDVVGGKATIKLTIETAARGLGRKGKRMRSDADQRLIDPNDGFFKHVSYAPKKQIYYGGKKSAASALSGS